MILRVKKRPTPMCWIAFAWMLHAGVASAQSPGYYEKLRYRADDPFLFCSQGQDPKRYPDRCWIPLPPYTGQFTMMPHCRPPNPYGKAWSQADQDSLAQYLSVCPQPRESGGWEGRGQPDQVPFNH
ncbi:MAG TPA: hypothetical protein VGC74_09500 [Stenotrophomonas sp.]